MKKMQNKPQATNTHKTILASIFAFIALSALYLLVTASMRGTIAPTRDTQEQATTSSQAQVTDTTSKDGMKTFRSDFMKIEFEYPEGYDVKETINRIELSSVNENIDIRHQSILQDNLEDYVKYFVSLRSNISSHELISLANYRAGKVVLKLDEVQNRVVYIFVRGHTAFTIASSSFSPGDGLMKFESIAKSFRILK